MIVTMPWWGFVLMLAGGIALGAGVTLAVLVAMVRRGWGQ